MSKNFKLIIREIISGEFTAKQIAQKHGVSYVSVHAYAKKLRAEGFVFKFKRPQSTFGEAVAQLKAELNNK